MIEYRHRSLETWRGRLPEYRTSMPILALDHDLDVTGLPESGDFAGVSPCGFGTSNRAIQPALGSKVFLIAAFGSDPRRHYLWEVMTVGHVSPAAAGGFRVTGSGYMLNPPQRLQGTDFDEFLRARAQLPELSDLEQLPFSKTLLALASRYRRPGVVDSETRAFCDEICASAPDNPDLFMFRSRVLEARGDVIGSLADLQTAAELFEGLDDLEGEAAS